MYVLIIIAALAAPGPARSAGLSSAPVAPIFASKSLCADAEAWVLTHRGIDARCFPRSAVPE